MPEGPIPILGDNTGAIKWAKDEEMTSRRRHVRVEYHYFVEQAQNGNFDVRQSPSGQNPTDGLIKPLGTDQFARFVQQMEMHDGSVLS